MGLVFNLFRRGTVEKYNSIWDMYQKKGMSRRSFIKACTAMAAMLGIAPSMLSEVVEAAEKRLPVVVWLHGHECTGCSEAFIRSGAPMASDVVLNMIALEYDDTLAAASGQPFEEHLQEIIKAYDGQYILAVEGAVPVLADSGYCMVGGHAFVNQLKEAAVHCAAIINYGSCSAWGGIQAARPNPTQSTGVPNIIGDKPIINVPGCPPIPEVMTGVIAHYAMFGKLPPVDNEGRPKQFFGNRLHDTCYRRPFFDAGLFAEDFNDKGAKAGWCLYKLGCRGPETYSSCGNLRWWNGLSYPVQSGASCIGCTNKNFWDEDPLYERIPDVPGISSLGLGNIDTVGGIALGAMAVGIAGHAATSAIQKKKRDAAEAKKSSERKDG